VFNLGDQYFLQNKKYENLHVPNQFIAGQAIYSYRLLLDRRISIAGIVFKPAALATLFNLPTYEYTEERIDLKTVFKRTLIDDFVAALKNTDEINEKVKLLERFVLAQYKQNNPQPDFIDFAANVIIEKNGMLHVNELMENVFMSRRNFERRFFKKVGLSPKYYARIRRIAHVMNMIAGKKKVDWAVIFSQCEFYDHSHFIKDFIEFTGRTPQQYLEENIELANMIDKPIMRTIH
jgi:AraC-like DNA-binding protein